MKRLASSTDGSSSKNMQRSKKAKKSKTNPKATTATTDEADKLMTEAIDEVCSQQSQESLSLSINDDAESLRNDSLIQDALTASRNLHTEIARLTSIIEQQQHKIDGLENKLTEILAILQNKSSSGHVHCPSTEHCLTNSSTPSVIARPPRHRPAADFIPGRRVQNIEAADQQEKQQPDEQQDDNHFTLVVHRTLNDISRRKRNVIVTGIAEQGNGEAGMTDKEAFENLCECYLSFKPLLAQGNCCVRIGMQRDGRPRRLLVKLHSEEAAAALLEAAPELRHSSNDFIAKNVFINPDLSPLAAKLAYEDRVKRRENWKQQPDTASRKSQTQNHGRTFFPSITTSGKCHDALCVKHGADSLTMAARATNVTPPVANSPGINAMAPPFEPSESRLIYRTAINTPIPVGGCSDPEQSIQLQRSPISSTGKPVVHSTDLIEVEADVHAPFDDIGRHPSSEH